MESLYIVLVGLPARGKSFVAARLLEGLSADGLMVRVFNNGEVRRRTLGKASGAAGFYHPENSGGKYSREEISRINRMEAWEFLDGGGDVAILDATNGSRQRRLDIERDLNNAPILYIECLNDDPDLLEASIASKARLPEFEGLSKAEAVANFKQRISYYENLYAPLDEEHCYVRMETLNNRILEEKGCGPVPHYIQIRDILVSDWVRNLYLARHGQSEFNVQGRIGGDASLTEKGRGQAEALAGHFHKVNIPYIFTSRRQRSAQTAAPIAADHPESLVVSLPEFDEISAGTCEGMSYASIRKSMPAQYLMRHKDKYNYVYPGGEGYVTLKERVSRGFRKAMFISGAAPGILIIGHQAINRMILSLFLFRPAEDVPYIYVPQDEYFHIVATHRKKKLELVRFMDRE